MTEIACPRSRDLSSCEAAALAQRLSPNSTTALPLQRIKRATWLAGADRPSLVLSESGTPSPPAGAQARKALPAPRLLCDLVLQDRRPQDLPADGEVRAQHLGRAGGGLTQLIAEGGPLGSWGEPLQESRLTPPHLRAAPFRDAPNRDAAGVARPLRPGGSPGLPLRLEREQLHLKLQCRHTAVGGEASRVNVGPLASLTARHLAVHGTALKAQARLVHPLLDLLHLPLLRSSSLRVSGSVVGELARRLGAGSDPSDNHGAPRRDGSIDSGRALPPASIPAPG